MTWKRAKGKVPLKLYIDKDLKEQFKSYALQRNSDMSKEITRFIKECVNNNKEKGEKV